MEGGAVGVKFAREIELWPVEQPFPARGVLGFRSRGPRLDDPT
jgi:hypothetical protein